MQMKLTHIISNVINQLTHTISAMQLTVCRFAVPYYIKVCKSNCQIFREVVGKNLQLKIQLTH